MAVARVLHLAEPDTTLPRVVAVLRGTARAASVIPLVMGFLVLFGWWQDIELFKRIIPGYIAMNPATAIGFILLGTALALWLPDPPAKWRRQLGAVLAALAASIGLLRLIAIVVGLDLGIDQLLFSEKLAAADSGLPNRMAPNTALNFLLLGSALAIMDHGLWRMRWPTQYLTIIAAVASLLALTGYAYGVRALYGVGSYIPMALHTATTFLIVAAGILSSRPKCGIMAVVSSRTSAPAAA
jgi:hypothetical protein